MKTPLILLSLLLALSLSARDLPPDSTEPMGQKFAARKDATTLRIALVGAGSSHHFPRDFLATDAETLKAGIPNVDVAATPNLDEALALMEEADVMVFSGNHEQFGTEKFQKALNKFADDRKGLVMLHAATWTHPWKDYNKRFIGGRTPSHGKGDFTVTVTDTDNPVTEGVPKTFEIWDENYRFRLEAPQRVHVCCENAPDQTDGPIPSVWTVKDPRARIVCITLGHDDKAHGNEAFRKILVNAVEWAGGR